MSDGSDLSESMDMLELCDSELEAIAFSGSISLALTTTPCLGFDSDMGLINCGSACLVTKSLLDTRSSFLSVSRWLENQFREAESRQSHDSTVKKHYSLLCWTAHMNTICFRSSFRSFRSMLRAMPNVKLAPLPPATKTTVSYSAGSGIVP